MFKKVKKKIIERISRKEGIIFSTYNWNQRYKTKNNIKCGFTCQIASAYDFSEVCLN